MRSYRAKITRAEVGLRPDPKARKGLSQRALAEATHIPIKVIQALEHGRLRLPRPEWLETIASVLELSADDRQALWLLAAGTPPPLGSYASGPDEGLARLVEVLYPNPGVVMDAAFTLHAHNRGVLEWLDDCDALLAQDNNFAKWLFLSPHAQHVLVNWEAFTHTMLSRLRAAAARWSAPRFPDRVP
jgi:transcriptional regulator with XRE-family HTH domain